MEAESRELLVSGARSFGLELTAEAVDAFSSYLELLDKWSKKVNLTGIKGERDRVAKLLVDSLAVAGFLLERGLGSGLRILDVGSGAGVPGIPLKLALPDAEVTLAESRQKRVFFLREVLRSLGLSGLRVFHGRSEDLEGEFDVMTARAVGSLEYLAGEGSRLLVPGGLVVARKGPEGREELSDSGLEAKGWKGEIREYELPGDDGSTSLVVLEKPGGST